MARQFQKYDTVVIGADRHARSRADAAVFRVMETNGNKVGVIDATLEDLRQQPQQVDRSLVQRATREQLRNAGLI